VPAMIGPEEHRVVFVDGKVSLTFVASHSRSMLVSRWQDKLEE
jgi:hypothetical protein